MKRTSEIADQASAYTALIDFRHRTIQEFSIQTDLADFVLNHCNETATLSLVFDEMLQIAGLPQTEEAGEYDWWWALVGPKEFLVDGLAMREVVSVPLKPV